MDFISEQSAEKIGQRHQAVNNNIIRGLKAPAKIVISASNLLIQKILDRLKQKGSQIKTGLVEIKVDNKSVYKGVPGQKPEVDKLTPEHKVRLESILSRPDPSPEKSFEISVDGKPVYKSEKGVEKINELDSPSNRQNSHQEIANLSALISAKSLLESNKTNSYENQDYRIEQGGNGLSITAKDGRGEIAQIDKSGQIAGTVSTKDTVALSKLSNQVKLEHGLIQNNSLQTQLSGQEINAHAEKNLASFAAKNQGTNIVKPQTQPASKSSIEESEELER
jgi:hypothetical protein